MPFGNEPELLVGVDVGTTMIKAAVVDLEGRELSHASSPTPWHQVPTGAELDPDQLLGGARSALATALDQVPTGRVLGVGITSMAETIVLLGGDGRPVTDSIIWHDSRGGQEALELVEQLGWAPFVEHTGLAPSFICTLVKLRWLSSNLDLPGGLRAQCVADWLVHCLGGEQVVDASLASRTGALHLATRKWWTEGLEWAGAPADLFPAVVQAGEAVGTSTGAVLERLAGAALTSAGHDHLCVAAGVDATTPAQLLDSCGTAEALLRAVAPLSPAELKTVVGNGLAAGWHTLPGRFALMGGQLFGGVLGSVLRLLGISGQEAVAALDAGAATMPRGRLQVVRELAFREDFSVLGVSSTASPEALWNAALDALSVEASSLVERLEAVAGPIEEVILTGGWSHLESVRRLKQARFKKVTSPQVSEAGARGAALFGGCAAGIFTTADAFPRARSQPLEL